MGVISWEEREWWLSQLEWWLPGSGATPIMSISHPQEILTQPQDTVLNKQLKASSLGPFSVRFSTSYIKILEPLGVLGNREGISLKMWGECSEWSKCDRWTGAGLGAVFSLLLYLPSSLPLVLGNMWNSKALPLSCVWVLESGTVSRIERQRWGGPALLNVYPGHQPGAPPGFGCWPLLPCRRSWWRLEKLIELLLGNSPPGHLSSLLWLLHLSWKITKPGVEFDQK